MYKKRRLDTIYEVTENRNTPKSGNWRPKTHFLNRYQSKSRVGMNRSQEFKIEDIKQNHVEKIELEVYSRVFDDIIKEDAVYGRLLQTVKDKYDTYIQNIKEKSTVFEHLQQENLKLKSGENLKSLTKQLRNAKSRENKFLELVKALKKMDVPVDETFKRVRKVPLLDIPHSPGSTEISSSETRKLS